MEISDVLTRIGMAFLAGIVLGLERESHGRAAGLRTMVLVCVAAATAMVLSDLYYLAAAPPPEGAMNWRPDPARLGAGILTGMGFLGGGVIIRQGNLVRGVTTASVLWLMTIIGLCFGSGELVLGFVAFGASAIALFVLPRLEKFVKNDWYATLVVTGSPDGVSIPELRKAIEEMNMRVKTLALDHDLAANSRVITCGLKFKKTDLAELPARVVKRLTQCAGVQRIEWK